MSTAVWVEQVDPDATADDAQAWWYGERLDVRADPTGNPDGAHPPCVELRVGPEQRTVLSPTQASALAAALLSAADWAEGKA